VAKNTGNNRAAIKWVRDRAKSAYIKMPLCCICDTDQDLELHHTHGMTNLFEQWCKKQGYQIDTDEDVLAIRDEFINTHHYEIYEAVYTLCNKHHQALHRVYGKSPPLHTAKKQSHWIDCQRAKEHGLESPKLVHERESSADTHSKRSWFSSFI
jgi:hypothetical protein